MTTSVTDFFSSNEINGALSPEQAAQLLELSAQGDTGASPDLGGVPATTTATDSTSETDPAPKESNSTDPNAASEVKADATAAPAPEPAPAPGPAEPDAANTVILAKDGKHTIPFAKLEEARNGMQHWKGIAEQTQQQLAQLQAEAAERAQAGQAPTKTDNAVAQATAAIDQGVDPAIFGDFTDADLVKGIAKLVDMRVTAAIAPMQADVQGVKQTIAPLQQTAAKTELDAHYEAIYGKHPDAGSLVESQELGAWIDSHPSFVRPALRQVLDSGTAPQVIELFDNFKKATGVQQAAAGAPKPDPQADAAAAAKAAAASAPPAIPVSLSDIPGGRVEGRSPHEQLAAKSAVEMVDAMSNMTPAQIDAFLNRAL